MRLRKPSGLAIVLVMGVAVTLTLTLISAAHALTIRLTSGATVVVVDDNGAGDINPAVGSVTFNGPVGDFIVNTSTGTSKPLLLGSTLRLDSLDVLSTGPGPDTLTIELTDIGFVPDTTLTSTIKGTLIGTGSTVATSQCVGYNNNPFECSPGVTITHTTFGPGAYAQTLAAAYSTTLPFAITETVNLAFSGSGSSSLGNDSAAAPVPLSVPVPQPRALLLLGLGLAGLWALPMLRASRRGRDA
jgi:hypothetical protein